MDIGLIIARLIHVGAGVFWAGSMFFSARFLFPALDDAGPEGGKVVNGLVKHGFMSAIPIAAALGILSGIYMFWRVSMGFNDTYMSSGPGRTYSIGGTAAIIAFAIGGTVVRSSMTKSLKLANSAASAAESERANIMSDAAKHRAKGAAASKIVASLLVITVICMAIGRYV
jgi:uncharacterized membrane protein